MARVEVAPASRADVEEMIGSVPATMTAVAARLDGRIIGIGGLYFQHGRAVAFCDIEPEMKRFPVLLHKTALRALRDASVRYRYIFATVSRDEKNARRWLERLGFEPLGNSGVMLWRA